MAPAAIANMSKLGLIVGFEAKKAVQMAKWFVSRAGGKIEKLKLIKLFYLSEREYISRYEEPMLYDELYSLQHGPICSSVLNGINGVVGVGAGWEDFERRGRELMYAGSVDRRELDHLSDADIEIIEHVWSKFGWMTSSALRRYTHENCPEYQAVGPGRRLRIQIQYADLYEAVVHPDPLSASDEVTRHRRRSGYFVA